MTDGRDRRRHRRYQTDDLQGTLYVSSDARVLNMSLTGLALESSSCLKPGKRYSIELEGERGRMTLPASVRWCRLDGTRADGRGKAVPIYQAGLTFRDVLSEKAQEVLGLLKEHVTVELERRLFARFQVHDHSEAQLSGSYELMVKTLSLSGLLALAEVAPTPQKVYDLEIQVPRGTVRVAGRIAYVNTLAQPEDRFVAEAGIEFLDLGEDEKTRLEALLIDQLE